MKIIGTNTTKLTGTEPREGELLITKIQRAKKQGELKMGVNLSMYRTNCFRCNEHPNPSQLVMDIEGFETYHELIDRKSVV